jgi:hypothetical protein
VTRGRHIFSNTAQDGECGYMASDWLEIGALRNPGR